MRRTTAKWLLILNYVVMFVLMLIFAANNNKDGMVWAGIVGIVVALILSHFLRCHSCGRGQGKSWLFAEYCPYCGEPLDDE